MLERQRLRRGADHQARPTRDLLDIAERLDAIR
jgi:hypothetical protein